MHQCIRTLGNRQWWLTCRTLQCCRVLATTPRGRRVLATTPHGDACSHACTYARMRVCACVCVCLSVFMFLPVLMCTIPASLPLCPPPSPPPLARSLALSLSLSLSLSLACSSHTHTHRPPSTMGMPMRLHAPTPPLTYMQPANGIKLNMISGASAI